MQSPFNNIPGRPTGHMHARMVNESRACRRLAWLWDPCHELFPICLRLQTLSLFLTDLLLSSGQMPISVPVIVWFL